MSKIHGLFVITCQMSKPKTNIPAGKNAHREEKLNMNIMHSLNLNNKNVNTEKYHSNFLVLEDVILPGGQLSASD